MDDEGQPLIEAHPEYAKAIGTISVEMVHMEIVISMALAVILHVPIEMANAVFFSPTSTGPRLAIFKNAAKQMPDVFRKYRDMAEELSTQATKCQNRRNEIVHAAWISADDGKSLSIARLPVNFKASFYNHNIKELYDLISRIRKTITLSDQFVYALASENKYPPWRRKRS